MGGFITILEIFLAIFTLEVQPSEDQYLPPQKFQEGKETDKIFQSGAL